jgi:hypothetical protein
MADFRIDIEELLVQRLVLAKLLDFPLGFVHCRGIGQGLGVGLALDFEGEPEVRTVTRLVGFVAAAIRLAAAATGGGNGTTRRSPRAAIC